MHDEEDFLHNFIEFSVNLLLIPTHISKFSTLSILWHNFFSNSGNPFDPRIPTFERKNPQHENSILFAIGLDYDLFERDDGRRGMEDVKLRPVGTLACRCSAHARRPKRIFIGSHRDRLHAILAHAKRNFTPVTKWKLCASVFCINDSPPLDASSYFRFNRKRSERTTGDEFSFSDSFSARSSFFFTIFLLLREERMNGSREYSKIWEIVFKYKGSWSVRKINSADDETFDTLEHCWIDVEIFFTG